MSKINIAIKTTLLFSTMTLFSRILAVLRDSMIANLYGTTYITDAYFVATSIPTILFEVIGVSIATIFIPVLSEILNKKNKREMQNFANELISLIIIVSILLFLITEIFSGSLVKLIAPNFTDKTYILTKLLTRISLFNLLLMGIINSFSAILQLFNCFVTTSLSGFIMNIVCILYMLLFSNTFGIEGLVFSTFFGYIIQLCVQIHYLKKIEFKYNFKLNLKNPRIKTCLQMLGPVIMGTGISQLNNMIDKIMASGLPAGNISAYTFSTKLSNIMYSIFAYSIITISYPTISSLVKENKTKELKQFFNKVLNQLLYVMIPLTLILILNNRFIVSVLFKRGAFTEESVILTSNILIFISVALIFTAIRDFTNNIFYSYNDTKTPMFNSVISLFINILLNILLVNDLGIYGLTLSTTFAIIYSGISLIVKLQLNYKLLYKKSLVRNLVVIIIASIAMVVFNNNLENYIKINFSFINQLFFIMFKSMCCLIIYSCIILLANLKKLKFIRKK